MFPGSVLILNKILLKISSFRLIETKQMIDQHLYYFPEEDPFSPSFEVCSYDSNLLIGNASETVWMYKVNLIFFIFIFGPIWLINRKCFGIFETAKKSL